LFVSSVSRRSRRTTPVKVAINRNKTSRKHSMDDDYKAKYKALKYLVKLHSAGNNQRTDPNFETVIKEFEKRGERILNNSSGWFQSNKEKNCGDIKDLYHEITRYLETNTSSSHTLKQQAASIQQRLKRIYNDLCFPKKS
jgi:uncharacterized protein YozE (UPF0346 family)